MALGTGSRVGSQGIQQFSSNDWAGVLRSRRATGAKPRVRWRVRWRAAVTEKRRASVAAEREWWSERRPWESSAAAVKSTMTITSVHIVTESTCSRQCGWKLGTESQQRSVHGVQGLRLYLLGEWAVGALLGHHGDGGGG